MKLIELRPSSSYRLRVPSNVHHEHDGRVCSLWRKGEPLLLQLSSYIRAQGAQILASDRLEDRRSKHAEAWRLWEKPLHPDPNVDQAAGEYVDERGDLWVHAYLVWPHLAVYVTISGPEGMVADKKNWAFIAVRSINLTAQ